MSSKVAYLLLFSKVNNILIVRNNNLIGLISLTGVSFKLFPAQQTVDYVEGAYVVAVLILSHNLWIEETSARMSGMAETPPYRAIN